MPNDGVNPSPKPVPTEPDIPKVDPKPVDPDPVPTPEPVDPDPPKRRLITVAEYQAEKTLEKYTASGVECPNLACEGELYFSGVIFPTLPETKEVFCPVCGWTGRI